MSVGKHVRNLLKENQTHTMPITNFIHIMPVSEPNQFQFWVQHLKVVIVQSTKYGNGVFNYLQYGAFCDTNTLF